MQKFIWNWVIETLSIWVQDQLMRPRIVPEYTIVKYLVLYGPSSKMQEKLKGCFSLSVACKLQFIKSSKG